MNTNEDKDMNTNADTKENPMHNTIDFVGFIDALLGSVSTARLQAEVEKRRVLDTMLAPPEPTPMASLGALSQKEIYNLMVATWRDTSETLCCPLIGAIRDFLVDNTDIQIVAEVEDFLNDQSEEDLKQALEYAHGIEFFASSEEEALEEIEEEVLAEFLQERGWIVALNAKDMLDDVSNEDLLAAFAKRLG